MRTGTLHLYGTAFLIAGFRKYNWFLPKIKEIAGQGKMDTVLSLVRAEIIYATCMSFLIVSVMNCHK